MTELETYTRRAWQNLSNELNNVGVSYGRDYSHVSVHNSVAVLSFNLMMCNTSHWKRIYGMQDQISQSLGLGDQNKARIVYSGLNYTFEVSKPPMYRKSLYADNVTQFSDGFKLAIGLNSRNDKPVLHNIGNGNLSGSLLVAGTTGSGKTNTVKHIIREIITHNSPDDVRVIVIDTKKSRTKYMALKNSAHLGMDIIDNPDIALLVLNRLEEITRQRDETGDRQKIYIVIDEAVHLFREKPETIAPVANIASTGAEFGVHLLIATQYPKLSDFGNDRQLKGNLYRLCGSVDDADSAKNITGVAGSGAERLTKPGDFLLVVDDKVRRLAIPEIMDSDFRNIERGMSPIIDFDRLNTKVVDGGSAGGSVTLANTLQDVDAKLLYLALTAKGSTGRYLGADKIRSLDGKLNSKGGGSIGQTTANEYVKLAARMREFGDKLKRRR